MPSEAGHLNNHVIILGFGRVGKIISMLLAEHYIPYVALDNDPRAVSEGQAADLPVYFGDAGSKRILMGVNAPKARCIVVALSSHAANYRTVY